MHKDIIKSLNKRIDILKKNNAVLEHNITLLLDSTIEPFEERL